MGKEEHDAFFYYRRKKMQEELPLLKKVMKGMQNVLKTNNKKNKTRL